MVRWFNLPDLLQTKLGICYVHLGMLNEAAAQLLVLLSEPLVPDLCLEAADVLRQCGHPAEVHTCWDNPWPVKVYIEDSLEAYHGGRLFVDGDMACPRSLQSNLHNQCQGICATLPTEGLPFADQSICLHGSPAMLDLSMRVSGIFVIFLWGQSCIHFNSLKVL